MVGRLTADDVRRGVGENGGRRREKGDLTVSSIFPDMIGCRASGRGSNVEVSKLALLFAIMHGVLDREWALRPVCHK